MAQITRLPPAPAGPGLLPRPVHRGRARWCGASFPGCSSQFLSPLQVVRAVSKVSKEVNDRVRWPGHRR